MTQKAKESPQIKKARRKLKEHMQMAEKKINPEAIKMMSLLIKEQLTRQKLNRINLKKNQIVALDKKINQLKQKTNLFFI